MSEILAPEPAGESSPAETPSTPEPAEQGETGAPPAQQAQGDDDGLDDGPPIPRKALLSERKKRQEAERQIAEYKGKLEAFERFQQRPQQQTPQQAPAEDLDPRFFDSPSKYVDERLDQRLQPLANQLRIQMGAQMMASIHPDYHEMEKVFVEQAKKDPTLAIQMHRSGNPNQFAYDWAKTFKEVEGIGSLADLRKKIREEVETELQGKAAVASASRATTSNAGARSSGAGVGSPDDESMSSILRGVSITGMR